MSKAHLLAAFAPYGALADAFEEHAEQLWVEYLARARAGAAQPGPSLIRALWTYLWLASCLRPAAAELFGDAALRQIDAAAAEKAGLFAHCLDKRW
jgi:hypothetical protein